MLPRVLAGILLSLGLVASAQAEGFFQVEVLAEDHSEWPITRVLLTVHDAGAEVLENPDWDIDGRPRYAYGLGQVPVWTFLPDPDDIRSCFEYAPDTSRPICWAIVLTHDGQEIADIHQISLPILRADPHAYLWLEYEAPGDAAPTQGAPHSATIHLTSLQGNRTSARQAPLGLNGDMAGIPLVDGPWAFLLDKAEDEIEWIVDGIARDYYQDTPDDLLHEAHERWVRSRDADCDFRIMAYEDGPFRDSVLAECRYELTMHRLASFERLVMGISW